MVSIERSNGVLIKRMVTDVPVCVRMMWSVCVVIVCSERDNAFYVGVSYSKNTLNKSPKKMGHLDKIIVFSVLIIVTILVCVSLVQSAERWEDAYFLWMFWSRLVVDRFSLRLPSTALPVFVHKGK